MLWRDPNGDFIFMLQAILESTVEALKAEQERLARENAEKESRRAMEELRALKEQAEQAIAFKFGNHLVKTKNAKEWSQTN